MKTKHWVITGFILIGVLFVWHNYQQHGGVSGLRSGLGIQS